MEVKSKNGIFFFLCLCILSVGAGLLIHLAKWTYREPVSAAIDPAKPMIALTFDDGPNAQYTPQVLDVLYENHALATFFVVGEHIKGNKNLLKKIVNSGNELGNHTYSHQDLTALTLEEAQAEFQKTQSEVQKVLPGYLLLYARPPYGKTSPEIQAVAAARIVLWDVDSGDWQQVNADAVFHNVVEEVKDGDIVIFHDKSDVTLSALKQILPELQKRGYQFVTLSQLYRYRNIPVQ